MTVSITGYAEQQEPSLSHIRLAPGDDKTSYQQASYKTNSLSLDMRRGQAARLDKIARTPQLGLPALAK
ncbi:MAG: hypothetical protein ACI9WC_003918, partial [Arenicella sp.]